MEKEYYQIPLSGEEIKNRLLKVPSLTDDGGGAIGDNATATAGGSVGNGATSGNGFSGGYNAKVTADSNGEFIDAIQLGSGTNGVPRTLQIYDYQLMNADGKIPTERFPAEMLPTEMLSYAKIETGSYVGTGKYGSSTPNTLTFSFTPKVFILLGYKDSENGWRDSQTHHIDLTQLTNEYKQHNVGGYIYMKFANNTLSWYVTGSSSAVNQFNSANTTYSYMAIG